MNNLAPVILFVYNRVEHTKKTIKALKNNDLAIYSQLIIYSDAPKSETNLKDVLEVRNYLKTIKGFKNITIIEQKTNLGLANSITKGVTSIVKKYGKVIVMEDDLVTSKYFLTFMNDALNYYENKKEVWHINAYIPPININSEKEVFFTKFSMSWGWATWEDRWDHYFKDSEYLIKTFDKKMINKFNLDKASRSWNQVLNNHKNKINTWAVFWYATIFLNEGYCLNPYKSLINNVGHDGTGENCSKSDYYKEDIKPIKITKFSDEIYIEKKIYNKIRQFYKKQIFFKIIEKIKGVLK